MSADTKTDWPRDNDGRAPLVPYPGWRIIAERLAKKEWRRP